MPHCIRRTRRIAQQANFKLMREIRIHSKCACVRQLSKLSLRMMYYTPRTHVLD
jgi:hypothetical protein